MRLGIGKIIVNGIGNDRIRARNAINSFIFCKVNIYSLLFFFFLFERQFTLDSITTKPLQSAVIVYKSYRLA